ncbi:hypothetical protein WJX72_010490 [[Myrmecia] bisecta]|uniref:UBC core domain-containing protein n=1 Tax=[Myrmecia] bisecta TaxID=41462 RepID=A0AAW1P962_9CHLO
MATRRRPPVHVFDLVERTDKTLGLVWRVAGDVDSDDSEDDDSQVDEEPLADGQASVAWLCPDPPGAAQTELITGLQVLDRSLIVGDFVARASDPLGQTGMVVAVKQLVDLQTPGGASATGLPASCLAPVLPLQGGQSVLHRRTSWIGVIGQVMEMVVVQFDDGCIIELRDLDDAGRDTLLFCNQQDYMFGEEFDCLYYPGQRVMLPALHVLDEVNYRVLKGRRPTRLKGAVLSVTASRAAVDWLETLCLPEGTQGVQPPPEFVSAEELLPFSYFCRDNWHLGQWGILSSEYDPATVTGPNSPWTQGAPGPAAAAMASQQRQHSVFEREPAMDEDWPVVHPNVSRQRAKNRKRNARRRGHRHETQAPQVPELPPTAQVINTRTVVDVRWQDGGLEQGLAAAECLPFEQQDDHDFWPEDVVEEKADELADTPPAWRPRTGIVQRVNAAARTAVIKWLEKGFDDQAALMDIACLPETTVSVYAIQQHSVYAYALGEVAVLLDGMAERKAPESSRAAQPNGASASPRPNSHAGMPASAHAARSGQHTQQQQAQGASSVDSLLPCVGQIIGMQDGAVKVHWLDGHESVVTRNQIYIVNNEVDDMTDDEEGASEASAESEYTYEGSDYMEDDSDELSEDADERPSYISAGRAGGSPVYEDLERPPFPSRQATSPLASGHAQPSHEAPATGSPAADASCASPSAEPVAKAESAANGSAGPSTAQPSAGTTFAPVAGFPQFEVLDVAPSGHHYMSQAPAAGNTRTFQKAVLKEWDSLRHNLPPSIWARAYESRMDLLRVLILGAAGTPYHNNLFCFDLQLPPDYPHSPPKLHYHSWGLRVNPNLYENGKVCLSLLGTWNGRASELWNPASSTLLQVLVSIQGLILVPKPYYNEAGFERQVGSAEGEKHARLYNENAFLLVCRSAMHILRRPPAPFEPLIQLHYNAHGATLLAACQAYLRGEAVGPSEGFKLMLEQLLPRLQAALQAECIQG